MTLYKYKPKITWEYDSFVIDHEGVSLEFSYEKCDEEIISVCIFKSHQKDISDGYEMVEVSDFLFDEKICSFLKLLIEYPPENIHFYYNNEYYEKYKEIIEKLKKVVE